MIRKEEKEKTFGEGNDVVVLEAEAALAVAEAPADDVAGGVLPPPLRVATGDRFGVCPAFALRLFVEESRSLFVVAVSIIITTPRTRR
ncbi:hypothetical protein L484_000196 [Morus notabilis]|uniref:Uncharacterized protein n=1 Tax=Morus notabilis TaxID=981085 RepID=W9SEI3_9ROSA|nr:hypothetical protein L484_000196 [Morus notabilis]